MKNYTKISMILCSIALICALILASMNLLTNPIIAKNNEQTKTDTIKTIYSDYDHYDTYSYSDLDKDYDIDKAVEERLVIYDSSDTKLGYIYTVSGKNAYGTIRLMVAISENNTVYQVEFLENGQSFAGTVATWVKSNFFSKGQKVYEAGFTSSTVSGSELTEDELNNLSVKCGATYGATLVKNLVSIALETEKEVA